MFAVSANGCSSCPLHLTPGRASSLHCKRMQRTRPSLSGLNPFPSNPPTSNGPPTILPGDFGILLRACSEGQGISDFAMRGRGRERLRRSLAGLKAPRLRTNVGGRLCASGHVRARAEGVALRLPLRAAADNAKRCTDSSRRGLLVLARGFDTTRGCLLLNALLYAKRRVVITHGRLLKHVHGLSSAQELGVGMANHDRSPTADRVESAALVIGSPTVATSRASKRP